MNKIDLEFEEWLFRVSDRLRLIIYDIKSKSDIEDEDYEILQLFHRVYYLNGLSFLKLKSDSSDEMALQQGLFGQVDSTADKGIKFEYELPD